jgi:preprotein translocase subunit SecG
VIYIAYTIHVVVCLFLILVVLLQQGKGADLSVFGGGSTQSAFGARGAATLLHKLTVAGFVAFIVTTVTIGFLQGGGGGGSVMDAVPEAVIEETAAPVDTEAATDSTEAETEAEAPVAGGEESDAPQGQTESGETGDPDGSTPDDR